MMLLILMGDSCIGTEIAGCLTMISQCYCHENAACSHGFSGVGVQTFFGIKVRVALGSDLEAQSITLNTKYS